MRFRHSRVNFRPNKLASNSILWSGLALWSGEIRFFAIFDWSG